MLDVCLLGCGGMMPLPRRFLTALLIRHEGSCVLVDCGESTQVALHLSTFSTKHIDHIIFTHYHGDHVSGLPGLLLTIANSHRTEPLHIWGGAGLRRIVAGLTVICEKLPYALVLHELPFDQPACFKTGGLYWETQPVRHRVPCLAYAAHLPRQGKFNAEKAKRLGIPLAFWSRLQKGEHIEDGEHHWQPADVMGDARKGLKVTYATDCRPSPELTALAAHSDLLVAEGLYGAEDKRWDAAEKGHMIFSEAALMAKQAQVETLWLTHFSPAMLHPHEHLADAQKIFPNTQVGRNLLCTTLRFQDE